MLLMLSVCRYEVGFIRNAAGDLVSDRRFNTSSILATYLGPEAVGPDRIAWDVDNPNRLKLSLPGVLWGSLACVQWTLAERPGGDSARP